ncbi:MAG: hypothetical protein ACETVX_02720 [bacterium]
MTKLTSALAIVFMLTSLVLVLLSAQRSRSRTQRAPTTTEERLPEAPAPIEPTPVLPTIPGGGE